MTKTAVYYHTDASGDLLYVGCSVCPAQRFMNHRSARGWATEVVNIRIVWFETREEALTFERQEIFRLRPKHNSEWRERRCKPRPVNEGQLYMLNWRDNHGGSEGLLSRRIGVPQKQVRKYFCRTNYPNTQRAARIALATDGYVPRRAFADYRHSLGRLAPTIRFPTPDEAAAEVAYILSLPWAREIKTFHPGT